MPLISTYPVKIGQKRSCLFFSSTFLITLLLSVLTKTGETKTGDVSLKYPTKLSDQLSHGFESHEQRLKRMVDDTDGGLPSLRPSRHHVVKKHSVKKRAASPSNFKYLGLGKRRMLANPAGEYGKPLNFLTYPSDDNDELFLERPNIRSALLKWTGLGRKKKTSMEDAELFDDNGVGGSNFVVESPGMRGRGKAFLWSGLGKRNEWSWPDDDVYPPYVYLTNECNRFDNYKMIPLHENTTFFGTVNDICHAPNVGVSTGSQGLHQLPKRLNNILFNRLGNQAILSKCLR